MLIKKITSAILAVAMVAAMSTTVFASDNSTTTYIEDGKKITEGWADEPCVEVNGKIVSAKKERDLFREYVGLGSDDLGLWVHGVLNNGTATGTVVSFYSNPKYVHGSSAQGSIGGLVRSSLVGPGATSEAQSVTGVMNGNRAYWRVEENA